MNLLRGVKIFSRSSNRLLLIEFIIIGEALSYSVILCLERIKMIRFILSSAALLLAATDVSASPAAWTITHAKRTVYASGNVATVDVRVQAKNTGASARNHFVITTSKKFGRPGHIVAYGSSAKNLLIVEGYNSTSSSSSESVEEKNMAAKIKSLCPDAYNIYVVRFNKEVESGKTVTFTYSMNLGLPFVPMPKTIHLYQRQFLQYYDT